MTFGDNDPISVCLEPKGALMSIQKQGALIKTPASTVQVEGMTCFPGSVCVHTYVCRSTVQVEGMILFSRFCVCMYIWV